MKRNKVNDATNNNKNIKNNAFNLNFSINKEYFN